MIDAALSASTVHQTPARVWQRKDLHSLSAILTVTFSYCSGKSTGTHELLST